jgi:hypothetical protein
MFLCGGSTSTRAEGAEPSAGDLLALFAARTKGELSELRSVRQLTAVSTRVGGGSAEMDQRVEMVFPDRLRRTMLVAGNEYAIVINGSEGFMASGELSLPLTEDRLAEAMRQLGRDLLFLATSLGRVEIRASLDGSREHDGNACRVVEVFVDTVTSRLCLDDSGRALSQTFDGRHPISSTPGRVEILYSDHRDTDGLFVPYRHVVKFDGQELVTVSILSLEVNPDLPDALFVPPSSE